MSNGTRRDANLDLLRSIAIALVLLHHVSQYIITLPVSVHAFTRLGAYGVDLFFVLSGFLIGSLYFRELQQTGRVALLRFWGRRWLRTLPLYYFALLLAYVSVFVARGEPFNPAYLLFGQNYLKTLPFFFGQLVTLC